MPTTIPVLDDDGGLLGELTVPDGTPQEEIRAFYAEYRQRRLAARAAKEAKRTEPRSDAVRCTSCGQEIPTGDVRKHVYEECDYRDQLKGIMD